MVKRKAMRDHVCYECRGFIKRGEHYHYHSGVWEGRPYSYKICFECDELRDHVESGVDYTSDDERIGFGDLIGSMSEFFDGESLMECYYMYGDIKMKRGGPISKYIIEEIMDLDPLYGHCLIQHVEQMNNSIDDAVKSS